MTGAVGEYLRELERVLHERHCHDPRIVDEAREHLADAVEDGVRRGLTREHAEREAVARFGPAALIAAQVLPGRSRMMARLTDALDTLAGHWRWVVAATAGAALLTSAVSYSVLPTFYRSESVILVVPQARLPWSLDDWRGSRERMESITTTVLSDSRLDPIVKAFGLGTTQQIRRDIRVAVSPEHPDAGAATVVFTVGFQSPDPRLSQKVTERLTSLFIVENFEDARAVGRAIGDQFRVTKAPSLPKDPLRPGLAKLTVSGAFAGLGLSIAALVWRKDPRSKG
jgi:capsular polysaccharide biosynthesis protein